MTCANYLKLPPYSTKEFESEWRKSWLILENAVVIELNGEQATKWGPSC
ncbi:hypothetical protein Lser_V15G38919 [Lactuca serriola]